MRRVKKFFEKFVKKFKLFERSEFLNFRILKNNFSQSTNSLDFCVAFYQEKATVRLEIRIKKNFLKNKKMLKKNLTLRKIFII